MLKLSIQPFPTKFSQSKCHQFDYMTNPERKAFYIWSMHSNFPLNAISYVKDTMNSIPVEQMSRNFQWILFDYVKGLTYPNGNNVPSFRFSEKQTYKNIHIHIQNIDQINSTAIQSLDCC